MFVRVKYSRGSVVRGSRSEIFGISSHDKGSTRRRGVVDTDPTNRIEPSSVGLDCETSSRKIPAISRNSPAENFISRVPEREEEGEKGSQQSALRHVGATFVAGMIGATFLDEKLV